jgi:hypothetical protein
MNYISAIGVKFNIERQLTGVPIKTRAYGHDYDVSMNFCPKTGTKLWTETPTYLHGFDPKKPNWGKFELMYLREYSNNHLWHGHIRKAIEVVVAIFHSSEDKSVTDPPITTMPLPIADLEKRKKDLQDFLTPLGLWSEADFGLHSFVTW